MRILFAAGDVGGARAILPVARQAAKQGLSVLGMDHGTFRIEGSDDWDWIPFQLALDIDVDIVIYATSVSDSKAFQVAQAARFRRVPIFHVLDNWSNYANRLMLCDGKGNLNTLIPDRYAVMDELAFAEAVDDGVNADILCTTGHPNLAALATQAQQLANTLDPNITLFVSEPVLADNGTQRGYTETSVSQAFVQALMDHEDLLSAQHILVAPHPREDREEVAQRWSDLAAECVDQTGITLQWSIVPKDQVRQALHCAGHVVGMTSILLYEAWLLGIPSASLQPGLVGTHLRSLSYRVGLHFCDMQENVRKTVNDVLSQQPGDHHPDLAKHQFAAKHILDTAFQIVF